MIQIRQKRQHQRQSIRRQYLDNHFKELRRKYFKFGNDSQKIDNQTKSLIQVLLEESMIFNQLSTKIREANFLAELSQLIDGTNYSKNLYETKFFLNIISNMFKDQLDAYEKETLFRLAQRLFEPLNIAHFNPQNKQQRVSFEIICQKIGLETLMFYLASTNYISKFLDEQDQIRIEHQIYPAFKNVLFYELSFPSKLSNIDEFQNDVWNFIYDIFDFEAEFYEDANRQKIFRLVPFFIDIIQGHEWQLSNNQVVFYCFPRVMYSFIFLYDIIIDYSSEFPNYFKSEEMLSIIELTFKEQIQRQDENFLKSLYSILRSFVDQKIFLKQIQCLLLNNQGLNDGSGFKRIMKSAVNKLSSSFRAVELLQAILTSFFYEKQFKELIEKFALQLVEVCCDIFLNFEKTLIGIDKNRKIIRVSLNILIVLMEKENVETNQEANIIFKHFERNSGLNSLKLISEWFGELDSRENSDIDSILEDIESIFLQEFQTPFFV